MDRDNRQYPRINAKFCVDCRSKNIWQNAQVFNISRGGMFIAAEKIEPVGTVLEVTFDFGKEDARKIQAKAEVVWSRQEVCSREDGKNLPPGMGVKFLKIFPKEAEDFLEELIRKWDKK